MKTFVIFSLLILWIAAGCEGFFLEYLRNRYNSFVKPNNQTETTETQGKAELPAQSQTSASYIPYPVPIAYGYGSGIVVEYGGQNYYVGPTSYPQNPPTFPYRGGPVMVSDGGYGTVYQYNAEQPYGYPQYDYSNYYNDYTVDPYYYISQKRKL
ncbi:hypothetical protein CHUAL_003043 [Chamberlinius hualienensis]